jgi:cyclophilin family peptidyl-prolyl cis-trans isomerase
MNKLLRSSLLNLILLLSISGLNSCFQSDNTEKPVANAVDPSQVSASTLTVNKNGLSQESIIIKTVHGNITFKLYPKKAPNTVTRIIKLVNDGFYDGIKFHRVVPDFVIQAGDPTGTGSGGSGKKLKAEFNDAQHIKGTVAMARTNDPDSADSQFYIALNTLPHLDNKYTVFGQVVEGLDVISKVKQGDVIISMVFNK